MPSPANEAEPMRANAMGAWQCNKTMQMDEPYQVKKYNTMQKPEERYDKSQPVIVSRALWNGKIRAAGLSRAAQCAVGRPSFFAAPSSLPSTRAANLFDSA